MARRFVLDTSAVLALLFGEAGADAVLDRGASGLMSAVSHSEAIAKSLDRAVPLDTVRQALDVLRLTLVPFGEAQALAAAAMRPATRPFDVSFADRACLATAAVAGLPVLTADRDWVKCGLPVEIVLIR